MVFLSVFYLFSFFSIIFAQNESTFETTSFDPSTGDLTTQETTTNETITTNEETSSESTTESETTLSPTTNGSVSTAQTTHGFTTLSPDSDFYGFDSNRSKVCIVMKMRANFTINYIKEDKTNDSVVVAFNPNADISADCGDDTQSITFNWLPEKAPSDQEPWSLVISFRKNDKLSQVKGLRKMSASSLGDSDDGKGFFVSYINLTYSIDNQTFPDAYYKAGTPFSIVSSDKKLFTTQSGKYYRCKSSISVKFSDGALMNTTNLQLDAFMKEGKNYEGTEMVCDEDGSPSSSVVPIIVGVVLGVLVIAVIVAYLIGRRRQSRSYEQF